jgi:MFS family permease
VPVDPQAATADDGWTRQRLIALVGGMLLITLIGYEQIAVSAAMPTVARDLNGLALYGVAFAIPLAATVLSMTIAGPWSDAKGPAPVLWTGTGMFAAGLVVAGCAPGMGLLIVGRTIQALGGGLVIVALYVMIARVFSPRLMPKAFVGNSVAWVAPALFGPGISALLVTHGLWRWVFFGAALIAVPAMLMLVPVLRGLPEHRRPDEPTRVRLLPAVGAAVGACLMSLSASRPVTVSVVLIGVGVALLAVSAPRLMPKGTYTGARGLPAVIMTRGLMGAAFMGTDVYLPLTLTTVHGLSPAAAGWTLTAGGLSWSLASWFAGRIGTDDGRRRAARIGLAGLGVGIGICLIAAIPAAPSALMYLGWVIGGGSIGLGYSPMSVLLLGMSPIAEQGRNTSSLQANEAVSTAVVLAVTSSMYSALRVSIPGTALVAVLAVPLVMAILGLIWSFRLAPGAARPAGGAGPDRPLGAAEPDRLIESAS